MYYVAKIEGVRIWNKVEDVEKIIKDLKENCEKITGIELSSNSIGYDVAVALAKEIKNLKNLEIANFRDIFVGRLKEDLPKSLSELMNAILDKKIRILDLSDNAFGPTAIHSFDFFLKATATLEELYLENNGLGPEGAEMVADSLLLNDKITLKVCKINRNRLENKGAVAFAKYYLIY
jgi:Ran GTPase-activating protein 1